MKRAASTALAVLSAGPQAACPLCQHRFAASSEQGAVTFQNIIVGLFVGLALMGVVGIASGGSSNTTTSNTAPTNVTVPAPGPSEVGATTETPTEKAEPSGYSGWSKGQLGDAITAYETSNHASKRESECWARTIARSYTAEEAVATKGQLSNTVTLEIAENCVH